MAPPRGRREPPTPRRMRARLEQRAATRRRGSTEARPPIEGAGPSMRVVVTGNLGYVGTVMTPLLSEQEFEVWGIDTGYYRDCLLGPVERTGVARQLHKDLRDVTVDDLHGADAIVHLGALSNDPTGELNPKLTEEINLGASVRLAELAKRAGVQRFLFASSCSIYGSSGGGQLDETSPMNPLTAYARSKVETERALSRLADDDFS